MARGNGRRMRVNRNPTAPNNAASVSAVTAATNNSNNDMHVKSVPDLLDELDRNPWSHMPPAAKSFLLKKRETHGRLHGHIDLSELVKFWTNPVYIKYTKGEVAAMHHTSWYIATQYLEIGMVAEARTVALNGAFFHQCYVSVSIAWCVHVLCSVCSFNHVLIQRYLLYTLPEHAI